MAITKESNILKLCPSDVDPSLAKILHGALVVQDVHASLAGQVENWRSRNVFELPRFVVGIVGLDCTGILGYQPIREFNLPDLLLDQLAGTGDRRVIV